MNTKTTGLLVIALIGVIGFSIFTFSGKGKNEVKTAPSPEPKNVMMKVSYADGEYMKTGNYTSPAGPEQVEVKITLKGGLVTEASVTSLAENMYSKKWQGVFVENFKTLVVGKDIKDLNLGKVSGSSLTPKGFNDAVAQIKKQAQS